jgi:hypothetical protein
MERVMRRASRDADTNRYYLDSFARHTLQTPMEVLLYSGGPPVYLNRDKQKRRGRILIEEVAGTTQGVESATEQEHVGRTRFHAE